MIQCLRQISWLITAWLFWAVLGTLFRFGGPVFRTLRSRPRSRSPRR